MRRTGRPTPVLRDAFRRVRVSALEVKVNAKLVQELGRRGALAEAEGLTSPDGDGG